VPSRFVDLRRQFKLFFRQLPRGGKPSRQPVENWGWKGPSPSKRDSIRCASCNRAAKLARFGQKNDSCAQRSDHLHIARKCWHTAYRITSISFRHVVIRDRRCFTAECAFGDWRLPLEGAALRSTSFSQVSCARAAARGAPMLVGLGREKSSGGQGPTTGPWSCATPASMRTTALASMKWAAWHIKGASISTASPAAHFLLRLTANAKSRRERKYDN
jgi:hypothetical protein